MGLWLGEHDGFFVPLMIVVIIVGALLLRWIVNRLIRNLIEQATKMQLHPRVVRSRSGKVLLSNAPLLHERRNQRLKTLGTVLRSMASFLIGVGATLAVFHLLHIPTTGAWASAGVITAAVAFGAQQLIRDFLTGAFLIVEDQYGVGDTIDIGTVSGTVEAVGLRLTQIRDDAGVLWHVRNGEIVRVGNKSQGHGVITVDIPVALDTDVEQALAALTTMATTTANASQWAQSVLESPEVTGPEELTSESFVLRITVKTMFGEGAQLARELRLHALQTLRENNITLGNAVPSD